MFDIVDHVKQVSFRIKMACESYIFKIFVHIYKCILKQFILYVCMSYWKYKYSIYVAYSRISDLDLIISHKFWQIWHSSVLEKNLECG